MRGRATLEQSLKESIGDAAANRKEPHAYENRPHYVPKADGLIRRMDSGRIGARNVFSRLCHLVSLSHAGVQSRRVSARAAAKV